MLRLLVQATPDRTGVYVAVGVLGFFAVVGLYFLMASRRDATQGKLDVEATYVFGLGDPPRLVAAEGATAPRSSTVLGHEGLRRFVEIADGHADMRITRYVFEDEPSVVPEQLERGALDERRLAQVEVADSKGTFVVEADGIVRAQPPLDRAVLRDLQDVLGRVLEST